MNGLVNFTFGEYLCFLRKSRGVSQKIFARRIGISSSQLCNIECGRRLPPSFDTLSAISDLLELSTVERSTLFELASANRMNTGLPVQIYDYLFTCDKVLVVITAAMNSGCGNDFWQNVLQHTEGSLTPDLISCQNNTAC